MKLKSFLFVYVALLITLVIINACSLNKRVYRPGYNIEWNSARKNLVRKEFAGKNFHRTSQPEILNPLYGNISASAANEISPVKTPVFLLTQNKIPQRKYLTEVSIDPCDTIIFKNGLKIKARILEISSYEIKYKMCDNQDGPLFIKNTVDISMINHSNGSVTELNYIVPKNNNYSSNSGSNSNIGQGSGSSTDWGLPKTDKSQIVAILFCAFLGFLGIHRFYMGYPALGVLMFFTLGCCGVLWIVDFVRIIIGDLKPKDGDFSEKI